MARRHKTIEVGCAILASCPEPKSHRHKPLYTLTQRHAELAGKFAESRNTSVKIKTAMMQVEAAADAKAGLRRPEHLRETPHLASPGGWRCRRRVAEVLVADKAPQATRKQAMDLQAAILAAVRRRDGQTVIPEGAPACWRLKEAAN